MGIINRDKGRSEQRIDYFVNLAATATGVTNTIMIVPYAASLDAVQATAFGLSGSPTIGLLVSRFIAGSGSTVFTIVQGSSNVLTAFGTSGCPSTGLVIPQIGSTLTTLQANDVLSYVTGGTNAAVTGMALCFVLRCTQDIKTEFNFI